MLISLTHHKKTLTFKNKRHYFHGFSDKEQKMIESLKEKRLYKYLTGTLFESIKQIKKPVLWFFFSLILFLKIVSYLSNF